MKDMAQMIHLVETERRRAKEGRRRAEERKYSKIKTEHMCMTDNKRMMKQTGLSPPKVTDQSTSYREHSFSKFADEQDNRRK
jgi:hypothetical protein